MNLPATDTIAAIATAPGRGGIGIVRVSGPQTLAIARALLGAAPGLASELLHVGAAAQTDQVSLRASYSIAAGPLKKKQVWCYWMRVLGRNLCLTIARL